MRQRFGFSCHRVPSGIRFPGVRSGVRKRASKLRGLCSRRFVVIGRRSRHGRLRRARVVELLACVLLARCFAGLPRISLVIARELVSKVRRQRQLGRCPDENPFERLAGTRVWRRNQGERHHARERRSTGRHHRRPNDALISAARIQLEDTARCDRCHVTDAAMHMQSWRDLRALQASLGQDAPLSVIGMGCSSSCHPSVRITSLLSRALRPLERSIDHVM